MNDLFINKIRINWDEINEYSYIREVASINQINELEFTNNITFFVGENGSGKSTILEAIAIAAEFNPKVVQRIIIFQHTIVIPIYTTPFN